MATAKKKRVVTHLVKPLPDDALHALQLQLRPKAQGGMGKTGVQVARELKVSPAAISSGLNGKYIGNVDRLAERIRGEYLKEVVACPVLGVISTRICQDERTKPFAATNPQRVRLFKACKTCQHNPNRQQGVE